MVGKPQDDLTPRGHDERNMASLVLIPTQDRLPKDLLLLERVVPTPGGQVIRIVCEGMPGHGLPRGIDGDLLVALINRFVELDCPADNVVHATAHALLQAAGLDTSARYYRALDTGLKRLKNTSFTVTEGWYDAGKKRYVSAIFNIVDNIDFTHGEHGMDRRTILRISLNRRITESIRSGHLKPLNLNLYHQLPNVGSRTLYRLLDVHLFEAAARGEETTHQFAVPMMSWAVQCGILDTRPHHVRTALQRMHTSLLDVGYLQQVTFTGRGQHTMVHYVYGDASSPAKPEHVELLLKYGVQRAQAEKAARELGDHVLLVVQKFEERLNKPGEKIQNTGAYLAKLLREAGSIVEAELTARHEERRLHEQRQQRQQRQQHDLERQQRRLDDDQRQRLLAAGNEAVDLVLSSFNLQQLQRRGLSIDELDRLREAVSTGRLRPEIAYPLVLKALTPTGAAEALTELRQHF